MTLLLRGLGLATALAFLPPLLPGQTTVWVDSGYTGISTGTQSQPYHSLTEAINSKSWVDGDVAMVATGYYTDSPALTWPELFPIVLPHGIEIRCWDIDASLPNKPDPVVVFFPSQASSRNGSCFIVDGSGQGTRVKVSSYLPLVPKNIPDDGQGLEVREFATAFRVGGSQASQTGATFNLSLDGVGVFECRRALWITDASLTGTYSVVMDVNVSRSLMRTATGTPHTPSDTFVDLAGSRANSAYSLSLQSSDLRADTLDLLDDMVHAAVDGASSSLSLSMEGNHISGRYSQFPPLQVTIKGTGVYFSVRGAGSSLSARFDDVAVMDADRDGIYGRLLGDSTTGSFEAVNGCWVADNGASTATSGSASGIHLDSQEGGNWQVIRVEDSVVTDNYRHGVYVLAGSFPDQDDKLHLVRVVRSKLLRNGLPLGDQEPGHGLFLDVYNVTVADLGIGSSILSGNNTSGFRLNLTTNFHEAHPLRTHQLGMLNSVFSGNLGNILPSDPSWSSAPVVLWGTDYNEVFGYLAQLTISDNGSPFCLAIEKDPFSTADPPEWLWQVGGQHPSSITNSILMNNRTVNGLNLAFYPLHPDPLFTRLLATTTYSDLGSIGGAGYGSGLGNIFASPDLINWLSYPYGAIFPQSSSPVVDAGWISTFPNTNIDIRGLMRPDPSGVKDMGAFELQEGEK